VAEFCIICAAPRSGTTFLGDAVWSAYDAAWPEEIFHEINAKPGVDFRNAEDWEQRGNFFTFRADAIRHRPELIYPDIRARRALFNLYLDNLRAVFPNDRFLIDIKYNSWHHLDGFWRSPTDPPGLIELVSEKNIPVVHLIRRNLFALYCSLRLAVMSDLWSKKLGDPAETRTLKVDLEDCRRWMTEMASTQKLFAKWLQGHPGHTLTYESLMDNGRFAEGVSEVFTNIFGRRPLHELTTTYTKILPPLYSIIENAQAVVNHFAGTEFEMFVKTSLECNADEQSLDVANLI
jgi:LPS sulfotransferase NodH